MRRFGLIGYPLSHSFSKTWFDEKFEREGLTGCSFENYPLTSIEQLPGLLEQQPGLEGLAVTIPYKYAVLKYLHDRTGIPAGLPACNCIRIRNGSLAGFNTDHIGFEKSLSPLIGEQHTRALVLGNGGSAAAVKFVLRKLGIVYQVVSRQLHDDASLTYADVDKQVIEDHKLIINTTPLGMFPNTDACPPIAYDFITPEHILFDLVYNPAITLFLSHGAESGAVIRNGQEMLILQAAENWRIWNE